MRRALLLLSIAFTPLLHAQQMKTSETITVERVLVDARVTLGSGDAVMGLTAKDFKVKIDGKPASVESVEWIPASREARAMADIDKPQMNADPNSMNIPEPPGRLLVFFFQTDFAR